MGDGALPPPQSGRGFPRGSSFRDRGDRSDRSDRSDHSDLSDHTNPRPTNRRGRDDRVDSSACSSHRPSASHRAASPAAPSTASRWPSINETLRRAAGRDGTHSYAPSQDEGLHSSRLLERGGRAPSRKNSMLAMQPGTIPLPAPPPPPAQDEGVYACANHSRLCSGSSGVPIAAKSTRKSFASPSPSPSPPLSPRLPSVGGLDCDTVVEEEPGEADDDSSSWGGSSRPRGKRSPQTASNVFADGGSASRTTVDC